MRFRLLIALAVVVAAAAAVSVSGVPAGGTVPGAETLRGVGFDVSVTFSLIYHVEWREKRGVPGGCTLWRDDSGIANIFAHNTGAAERPRLKPLQGHLFPSLRSIQPSTVVPKVNVPEDWARLDALGAAKGSADRQWIQRGGPPSTPCGGQVVTPFVPSPDDCGRKEYTPQPGLPTTIRAESRRQGSELNIITQSSFRTAGERTPVLSVSVPMGPPFAKCALSTAARPIFTSMGVPLTNGEVQALRVLGVDKTRRIEAKLSGACDDDPAMTDEFGYCKYSLKGWIAIRHIQRNPYKR